VNCCGMVNLYDKGLITFDVTFITYHEVVPLIVIERQSCQDRIRDTR
jgi:hypothetical protein